MSLRDQLLAKGLVSRKDARRVDQQLREERKHKQGKRKRKSEVQAEAEAARRQAHEEDQRRRAEERKRREAERAEAEHRNRVRQIVRDNRIRSRGPVRFHHPGLDGRTLQRLEVSERVAWKLRAGECAIAALPEGGQVEYAVISARAAQRLETLQPELVVFWTRDTRGLSDPAEALWQPEWEISLAPRRLRPDEGAVRAG